LSGVHACRNAGFSLLLTPGSKKYRVLHGIGSDQPAPVDRRQSPARQPHRGHRRSPKPLGDPVEQRRQPLRPQSLPGLKDRRGSMRTDRRQAQAAIA